MMDHAKLFEILRDEFGKDAVTAVSGDPRFPCVELAFGLAKKILRFCAFEVSLKLDFLEDLIAVDTGGRFELIYRLLSTQHRHRFSLRVALDRGAPEAAVAAASVTDLWRSALCLEREIAELFGIVFEGHPSLDKLLLPEGWRGFPMRKDYEYPEDFGGIEHRRAPLRKEHARS